MTLLPGMIWTALCCYCSVRLGRSLVAHAPHCVKWKGLISVSKRSSRTCPSMSGQSGGQPHGRDQIPHPLILWPWLMNIGIADDQRPSEVTAKPSETEICAPFSLVLSCHLKTNQNLWTTSSLNRTAPSSPTCLLLLAPPPAARPSTRVRVTRRQASGNALPKTSARPALPCHA